MSKFGQIVLVLQGGGALGAYQAGVYEAMHEAGIEPDWVIGTSIGAINASLIAGAKRNDRVARLRAFWDRVAQDPVVESAACFPFFGASLPNWITLTAGVSNFFQPNPRAFLGPQIRLAADSAGYYSTQPLEATLCDLVDFSLVNKCSPRLTVGAAYVRTAEMRYFDSRDAPITVRHVMASGALPPAFPAVRIEGELYWDGGILSNTPVEAVFDDRPRRNSLIFAVHIWNPDGAEPETITEVLNRQKDYSILQPHSRADRAAGANPPSKAHRRGAGGAPAAGRARHAARSRNGELWLPDAHACGAPSRAAIGGRGSHQRHRLQPRRNQGALGGGPGRRAAHHRQCALARRR
jgi:predicted acylesterase/phospholipase RssA